MRFSKSTCFLDRPVYAFIGVHSPMLSGKPQAEAYRPLFLPLVLVGDSKLGGISSTISAYESLLLRGFIVDCVVLFRDDYYRNWEYLQPYFAERGIRVEAVSPPPPPLGNKAENFSSTEQYYDRIVSRETDIQSVQRHLDSCHSKRLVELESMSQRTLQSIWWPFVQHGHVLDEKDVAVIDSANSDFFSIYSKSRSSLSESLLSRQFDGSASWWTQTLGHANSSLTLAAARASGRYGHVMFPKATHLPALKLAERMIQQGPGKGWASRAFFSDNGSTGMEVALKMALRAFSVRHGDLAHEEKKTLGILGLKGSYHGDTIGAMDACEEGVFTCEWHSSKGFWIDPPTVGIRDGRVFVSIPSAIGDEKNGVSVQRDFESLAQVYNIPARLATPLAHLYSAFVKRTLKTLTPRKLAALVIEPLVMGAGGMLFVDPLFQRVLVDTVRGNEASSHSQNTDDQWSGLPVIFDEVFVGLYRLGVQSTALLLGVKPDISVYAKMLTGGLVPLAITLTSDSIFRSFWSGNKIDALLHGHSYTAHAVGCEVANESLEALDKLSRSESWKVAQRKWDNSDLVWSLWSPEFVNVVSKLPFVSEVMTLGTLLSFKLKDQPHHAGRLSLFLSGFTDQSQNRGYSSHSAERLLRSLETDESVHFRTLGHVAYFITSANTDSSNIRKLEYQILLALQKGATN